ncbi:MAG: hypothetical protein CK428_27380 [Mycobacterium sp.]|nr:MAG: hypothetical protein CK428_27380 [Mycobacterium sp.]
MLMTIPASAEVDDFEREHLGRIDDLRAALLTQLATASDTLHRAAATLARLRDNDIYDVEFADGRDGDDIAAFLGDSIRFVRASYALVHTVIDKETP